MGFTKILALLIAASSASAFAQKKVLFLDLNDGKKEIAEAKKMTKTKGDQLTVFPGAGEFDKEKLKELMKGQKFDSIVISGHNGGSSYSGTKGNVEVGELLSIMEETQNDQVQSLYLLGCNTANKSKIYFWKEALPNLKFIAGYDGTAPSSERLAGLKYFSDTYAKEDDLISTTDPAKLKAALQKVQYIFDLEASVYVSCQEDSEYHWLSQRDAKDRFSELSTAECGARIKEYKDLYLEKIRQYWEGVLEPTAEDTRTGFLRKAYTFTRQNEHCLGVKDGGLLDFAASGDAMLFLLFNKDFNRSFLEYYDPLLGETLDTLTALETDEDAYFQKKAEEMKKQKELLDKVKAELPKYEKLVEAEKSALMKEIDVFEQDERIPECAWSSEPPASCVSLKEQVQLYKTKRQQLNNWDNFRNQLDWKIMEADSANESYARQTLGYLKEGGKLTRAKELLQKLKSNPAAATRKEMMELTHEMSRLSSLGSPFGTLNTALNASESLSDGFPFSWHERIEGTPVEAPSGYLNLEAMRGEAAPPKEKGLQEIAGFLFKN